MAAGVVRRRLVTFLTVLSLLLCGVAVALWVQSYSIPVSIERARNQYAGLQWDYHRLLLVSSQGGIGLYGSARHITLPGTAEQEALALRDSMPGRWYWNVNRLAGYSPAMAGLYAGDLVGSGQRWVGFGFYTHRTPPSGPGTTASVTRRWSVMVPWAAVVLLLAALPIARVVPAIIRARRRRLQRRVGLCPRCG